MLHLDQAQRLIRRAVSNGATVLGPMKAEWDLSGKGRRWACKTPVTRESYTRKDRGRSYYNDWNPGDPRPVRLITHVRCRKCGPCRMARAQYWRNRAVQETAMAARTWFMTITFAPDEHFLNEQRVRTHLAKRGVLFDELPRREQFAELVRGYTRMLQLAWKRLRKNSGAQVRFMLVAEEHSDRLHGYPHFHALVHEVKASAPVSWRQIKDAFDYRWGFGHVKAVLAVGRTEHYVTKYIAKDLTTRLIASKGYGLGADGVKRRREAQQTEPRTVENHNEPRRKGGLGGEYVPPFTGVNVKTSEALPISDRPPPSSKSEPSSPQRLMYSLKRVSLAETFVCDEGELSCGCCAADEDLPDWIDPVIDDGLSAEEAATFESELRAVLAVPDKPPD